MGEVKRVRLHLVLDDGVHGLEPAAIKENKHEDESADVADDGHHTARKSVWPLRMFVDDVTKKVDGHVPVFLERPCAADEGAPDKYGLGQIERPYSRMANLAEDRFHDGQSRESEDNDTAENSAVHVDPIHKFGIFQ